jgi:hypothetical protein
MASRAKCRAKSKRLASGSSSSQPSVGKSYSSRHAAKGTPPAVFAPMGNYNRSSLSSTEVSPIIETAHQNYSLKS